MYCNSLQEFKCNSQKSNNTGSKKFTDVMSKARVEHTDTWSPGLRWTSMGTWVGASMQGEAVRWSGLNKACF